MSLMGPLIENMAITNKQFDLKALSNAVLAVVALDEGVVWGGWASHYANFNGDDGYKVLIRLIKMYWWWWWWWWWWWSDVTAPQQPECFAWQMLWITHWRITIQWRWSWTSGQVWFGVDIGPIVCCAVYSGGLATVNIGNANIESPGWSGEFGWWCHQSVECAVNPANDLRGGKWTNKKVSDSSRAHTGKWVQIPNAVNYNGIRFFFPSAWHTIYEWDRQTDRQTWEFYYGLGSVEICISERHIVDLKWINEIKQIYN